MRITLLIFHLHLPVSHSLKDKRRVIKGLKDRISNRFNVSIAEVDYQGKWQRSTLAVVWVSPDGSDIDRMINQLDKQVNQCTDVELLRFERIEY